MDSDFSYYVWSIEELCGLLPETRTIGSQIDKGIILSARRKAMKTSKLFRDFNKITMQCELRRTLEFTIGRATYRVEVFYCYSYPKSPWCAQVYSEKRSGWKCIPDFPWVSEKNEEAAIRAALSFLQDLH